MSEYVLETRDLGISFGGLKAVQNVNLKKPRRKRWRKLRIVIMML